MATSRSFGEFARRMNVVSRIVGKNVEKAVRRAAIAALDAAVVSTPVDTGRARANWVVSVGRPSEYVVPPSEFGNKKISEGEAQALANSTVTQGKVPIETWKLGIGPIFIANSVPYIIALDEGASHQAPEGMSQFAVQAAQRELKKARLLRSF
jgi:hypothetical protein